MHHQPQAMNFDLDTDISISLDHLQKMEYHDAQIC